MHVTCTFKFTSAKWTKIGKVSMVMHVYIFINDE